MEFSSFMLVTYFVGREPWTRSRGIEPLPPRTSGSVRVNKKDRERLGARGVMFPLPLAGLRLPVTWRGSCKDYVTALKRLGFVQ